MTLPLPRSRRSYVPGGTVAGHGAGVRRAGSGAWVKGAAMASAAKEQVADMAERAAEKVGVVAQGVRGQADTALGTVRGAAGELLGTAKGAAGEALGAAKARGAELAVEAAQSAPLRELRGRAARRAERARA